MKHTLAQNVGVDISKDFLDVATYPAGEAASPTTPKAIAP